VERPAEIVVDAAGLVDRFRKLPYLLDAEAIFLRVTARIEAKAGDQVLCQRAAGALPDQRVFCLERDTAGVAGLGISGMVEAEIAGDDASDGAVRTGQQIHRRRRREDVDAEGLGFV